MHPSGLSPIAFGCVPRVRSLSTHEIVTPALRIKDVRSQPVGGCQTALPPLTLALCGLRSIAGDPKVHRLGGLGKRCNETH